MSDGYRPSGRCWAPQPGRGRRAFLYLHGIQSHGGWFEWSASLLAETGSAVLLPDRRGSGLNTAARGDVPSWRRWLADLDELAEFLRCEHGAQHLAVVGVSWGGKLAAAWALHRIAARPALPIDRLLLIAPGIFPAVDVGCWNRVRIGVAAAVHPRQEFSIPLQDAALFTDNPAGRRYIVDDAARITRATARFLVASAQLDRFLARAADGTLPPTTLLLAGRDRIIRNAPTDAWVRRVAATAEVRTFPAATHTLEFESDPAAFREALVEWSREAAGDT